MTVGTCPVVGSIAYGRAGQRALADLQRRAQLGVVARRVGDRHRQAVVPGLQLRVVKALRPGEEALLGIEVVLAARLSVTPTAAYLESLNCRLNFFPAAALVVTSVSCGLRQQIGLELLVGRAVDRDLGLLAEQLEEAGDERVVVERVGVARLVERPAADDERPQLRLRLEVAGVVERVGDRIQRHLLVVVEPQQRLQEGVDDVGLRRERVLQVAGAERCLHRDAGRRRGLEQRQRLVCVRRGTAGSWSPDTRW